jgi:SNF2 family DNA or RNA helicase
VSSLYPFQEAGAAFLAERRVAILGDGMGLGKCAQAIVAADRINAIEIIVVCPKIACETWVREWTKWQTVNRSIQILTTGTDVIDADVAIVSYSLVGRVHTTIRARRNDLLIADEAHALKTPGAQRTQAIYGRAGIITATHRIWLLSGTIAPNHPGELWVHLKAMRSNQKSQLPNAAARRRPPLQLQKHHRLCNRSRLFPKPRQRPLH